MVFVIISPTSPVSPTFPAPLFRNRNFTEPDFFLLAAPLLEWDPTSATFLPFYISLNLFFFPFGQLII